MINERGGVNGRKVNFISYDDAYSPSQDRRTDAVSTTARTSLSPSMPEKIAASSRHISSVTAFLTEGRLK
jgi:hypothetical protein